MYLFLDTRAGVAGACCQALTTNHSHVCSCTSSTSSFAMHADSVCADVCHPQEWACNYSWPPWSTNGNPHNDGIPRTCCCSCRLECRARHWLCIERSFPSRTLCSWRLERCFRWLAQWIRSHRSACASLSVARSHVRGAAAGLRTQTALWRLAAHVAARCGTALTLRSRGKNAAIADRPLSVWRCSA